jgi:hypothetical protein
LTSMPATAVCAVMPGACRFAATADWVRDPHPPGRAKPGFSDQLPVPTTFWRPPTRIDDTQLAAVLTGRVRRPTTPARASGHRWRMVIAIDGTALHAARPPDGRQVHPLSAVDMTTGVVLAYLQIAVKSNEVPAFPPGWAR